MRLHSCIRLMLTLSVGCVFSLPGCNRTTVVAPENGSSAEEPAVARAKMDTMVATRFTLPDDDGGKLLAKLLPPKQPRSESLHQTKIASPKSSAQAFSLPSLPLPNRASDLPRLPEQGNSYRTKPRLELDETLGVLPEIPPTPAPPMPTGAKVRVPSPNVSEPVALPILATTVIERASLEDPTLEIATASALAARVPGRTSKAPFLKLTITDPYDGRRKELPSLAESHEFPLGTPSRPPH